MQKISKAKISLTASLQQRKMRLKEGLFVAEGRKCVADTLGKFKLAFLVATAEWYEYNLSSWKDIPEESLFTASESEMKKMSSLMTPPEVMAVYHIPVSQSQEELSTTPLPEGLYVMLDSIQDPGNLGTILRTAHWFGIDRIFASHMTADVFNPKTVQASMGSIASVRVDYTDLPSLLSANPSLPVIGLQLKGKDIFSAELPRSGFLVFGNEGNGLSPSMQSSLTLGLTIPPFHSDSHPESLNVAVAAAVTLALFRK